MAGRLTADQTSNNFFFDDDGLVKIKDKKEGARAKMLI